MLRSGFLNNHIVLASAMMTFLREVAIVHGARRRLLSNLSDPIRSNLKKHLPACAARGLTLVEHGPRAHATSFLSSGIFRASAVISAAATWLTSERSFIRIVAGA